MNSARGHISPVSPTGAMPKGTLYVRPKSVVVRSGFSSPRLNTGASVTSPIRSRFLATARSSPVPQSRYSQAMWGSLLRVSLRRSLTAGYRCNRRLNRFSVMYVPVWYGRK